MMMLLLLLLMLLLLLLMLLLLLLLRFLMVAAQINSSDCHLTLDTQVPSPRTNNFACTRMKTMLFVSFEKEHKPRAA